MLACAVVRFDLLCFKELQILPTALTMKDHGMMGGFTGVSFRFVSNFTGLHSSLMTSHGQLTLDKTNGVARHSLEQMLFR